MAEVLPIPMQGVLPNPMDNMGKMIGLLGPLNEARAQDAEFKSRNALGAIYQKNVQPDGSINWAGFMRDMASNPEATYRAQEAVNNQNAQRMQEQEIMGKDIQNKLTQFTTAHQVLDALAGDETTNREDLVHGIAYLEKLGIINPITSAGIQNSIPKDEVKARLWAKNVAMSLASTIERLGASTNISYQNGGDALIPTNTDRRKGTISEVPAPGGGSARIAIGAPPGTSMPTATVPIQDAPDASGNKPPPRNVVVPQERVVPRPRANFGGAGTTEAPTIIGGVPGAGNEGITAPPSIGYTAPNDPSITIPQTQFSNNWEVLQKTSNDLATQVAGQQNQQFNYGKIFNLMNDKALFTGPGQDLRQKLGEALVGVFGNTPWVKEANANLLSFDPKKSGDALSQSMELKKYLASNILREVANSTGDIKGAVLSQELGLAASAVANLNLTPEAINNLLKSSLSLMNLNESKLNFLKWYMSDQNRRTDKLADGTTRSYEVPQAQKSLADFTLRWANRIKGFDFYKPIKEAAERARKEVK